ncbi:TPA: Panacea domain-containing protein [Aeromonas hydrophila]
MFSTYDPVNVAWNIVQIANNMQIPLTHMQLQKLVYIAHGFSLAAYNKPLISEPVSAWKYGPVIPRVYHEFKKFGGVVINSYAPHVQPLADPNDMNLLQSVVSAYGKLSGTQLSELTHRVDTPWYKTWLTDLGYQQDNAIIPNHVIQSYYKDLLGKSSCTGL